MTPELLASLWRPGSLSSSRRRSAAGRGRGRSDAMLNVEPRRGGRPSRLATVQLQETAVALSPPALALHRVLVAEAQRFPQLIQLVNEAGAGKGVDRIAALLEREAKAGSLAIADSRFAAEQFLNMVLSVPQKRALGFGEIMSPDELARWTSRTVALFLDGCRGKTSPPAL